MTTRGLPEWYKELLLKKQFEVPIERGEIFYHRDGQSELEKFEKEIINEETTNNETPSDTTTQDMRAPQSEARSADQSQA